MAAHTFVPLLKLLDYITNRNQVFSALVGLSFNAYNFALVSDITIVKKII
jgi:hypothetical protein